jgi:hypothetical protein
VESLHALEVVHVNVVRYAARGGAEGRVTAKVAAATIAAAAAAPFVVGAAALGLAGFGLYKLFKT